MKKLFALLLLGLTATGYAAQQSVGGPPWAGLHNSDASLLIGDNEAQDLSNVDITIGGLGVKKRSGYAQYKTLTISTAGVRGGYYFRDASGNDNLVFANDRRIYKSVNGAAFTAIVTTDTAGSYYDFSDSQGKLWRTNSNRDELLSYNGTAVTYYPTLPKGKQNEILPDRFVISGTTNTNSIYFSAASDFTNFTTGIEEADPFTEVVGLTGQDITAIKYANGRLYIWTKNAFYFWEGTNQYNAVIENVSNTVGCDKPNSILFDNGILYWQARDRFFYAFDGSAIQRISQPVDTSTYGTGGITNLIRTTEADFDLGTFPTTNGISSDPSGSLVYGAENACLIGGSSFALQIASGSIGGSFSSAAQSFIPTANYIASAGSVHSLCPSSVSITTVTLRTDSGGLPSSVIIATANVTLPTSTARSAYFSFATPVSLSAGTTYWLYVSSLTDTGTGCYVLYEKNTDRVPGTFIWGGSPVAYDLNYEVFSTSGVYQSDSMAINPSATSFGGFLSGLSAPTSSSLGFAVYTDSNTTMDYASPTSFVSSQTVTNGQNISLSTNAYVAFTTLFSRPATCTELFTFLGIAACSPSVSDVTISYYDPSVAINSFGVVDKNDRLIWSQSEAGNSVPNISLIYDIPNRSWLKYSFPFEAAVRVDNDIYFGGPSTGVVYLYGAGNNDAGTAVTAYWKSKDYISANPYIEKNYRTISLVAKTQASSNLDLTWTVNTSSATAYNISLTNTNLYVRNNTFLPNGRFGTLLNLKFGNDDADAPFEVYSLMYEYEPRQWRVLP